MNQLSFAVPLPLGDEGNDEPEAVVSAAIRHLKRKREGAVCDTVVKSIADVDFKQERENLWNRGLFIPAFSLPVTLVQGSGTKWCLSRILQQPWRC